LICFGLAAVIGVPTYLFARDTIGNSTAILLMIGLMMPFFFLAMFEKDGLPAERVMRNMLRTKFWPSVRVYKTENIYKYLNEGGNMSNTQQNTVNHKNMSERRSASAIQTTQRNTKAKTHSARNQSNKKK